MHYAISDCCRPSIDEFGCDPRELVARLFGKPAETTEQYATQQAALAKVVADSCACYRCNAVIEHQWLSDGTNDNMPHVRTLLAAHVANLTIDEIDEVGGFGARIR